MERNTGYEHMGKEKTKGFFERCNINIHNKRKRLADTDGICYKYSVDGLTIGGVFQNDTPEFIKEITSSQEKCKTGEEEETVITITKI